MNTPNYTVDNQGRLDIFAVEPKMYVDQTNRTGFTEYAERMNGRFAMIGFVSLLALEILSKHGFLDILKGLTA
jgi:hypothetical protein